MKTNEQGNYSKHGCSHNGRLNTLVTAAVFIIVGLLFLGRNLGIVDSHLFHILVSWKMLLIVIGVTNLLRQRFLGGIALIAVGGYFLLPELTDIGKYWSQTFWPIALILIGIAILFKPKRQKFRDEWNLGGNILSQKECSSKDGFVASDNIFGSVHQIVLDPVFNGANLKCTFGGTILDLRRTQLEAHQTFIDVECTFGGIEIYVPADWNVQTEIRAILGGSEDKRYNSSLVIDREHLLIIRGAVTFGGVVLKS